MYIVAIGWLYVALMMSVAEATNSNGTVLGAIVTFFVYGLAPVALVVYLMRSPGRGRAIKAREAAAASACAPAETPASDAPDAGGQPAAAAEPASVAPVRKEP